jgi:peptidoglycan/xylan/chitin deacetylase (PgdA/CDA1 family)
MKIILSHDVDHITVHEHWLKDMIIPKFYIRSAIELLNRKIAIKEFLNRLADLKHNKWNGVEEVIAFNKSRNINSTFFVGVSNGVGLSYRLSQAELIIKKIVKEGFEIGVHGIAYNDAIAMKEEFNCFKKFSGLDSFGIRMHYLRMNETTINLISNAGYLYDASTQDFKNPYHTNGIWEFPLQIMDGWIINGQKRWQVNNLEQAKLETIKLIVKARESNINYLSILFHDRYFSDSFMTWKKWYVWLIDYLLDSGHEFITHQQAIHELSAK